MPSPALAANQRPSLPESLNRHIEAGTLAGAVILVGTPAPQVFEAVGHARPAIREPMRRDSLFWIASITKPITATAFMMLVEEGRVSLDDPVHRFIPGFRHLRVTSPDGTLHPLRQPVIIRHILSHTSGMRMLNSRDAQKIDSVSLEESVAHSLEEPLLAEPGTEFRYSNEGINTAGRLIEILSGQPYETFLHERLFGPLGMKDTTFLPTADQLLRLVPLHRPGPDGVLEETQTHYLTYPLDASGRHPSPGGGLFSTAEDLFHFALMLANGGSFEGRQFISSESLRQMTTKQTGPLVEHTGGFGFIGSGDGRIFGHGGVSKVRLMIEQEQIRIFLTQLLTEWPEVNPITEFEEQARLLFPS